MIPVAIASAYLPQASSIAADVDWVFDLIFWVCAVFLAIIVGLTGMFVIKYRHRRHHMDAEPSPTHSTKLEVFWTAIPLALVFVIFGTSTAVYLKMIERNPAAVQIQVTARKWSWYFDHPEGKGSPELHLLVNRPVELVMSADDVLHSLYVPAFRVKQDIVPGRYTRLRFTPTLPGRYPLFCTEFCGRDHSAMRTEVVVHKDAADYEKWLAQSAYDDAMPLAEVGAKVWAERGCKSCHSLDGTIPKGGGPSFRGLWGKNEAMSDGRYVKVDENYIRESVLDPNKKLVLGFGAVMPPTPLEERELRGIIAFIKSKKR